ncbi:conserved hypothetical protein [Luminiphilus syltensis NOR5-1B]|uniref:D-glutamate cyclase-like C-terminal domain-containing protein n=1 Tax=Luminiphilus syltensis NOR5-1B TaxID=565045 RepID=B8KSD7_9GAMM|nr:glutamate cyclase domain-containing protein [Luminiphilus syltensis]EED35439.1 conserved hypothetical protein [Luminiphilus syltensis NOR5-1B]
MTDAEISRFSDQIEALLVNRNPRGMSGVRDALKPGYVARAARRLLDADKEILIATGFPVANTFETDGPAGAIALYDFCLQGGGRPVLMAGAPLINAIGADRATHIINGFSQADADREAERFFAKHSPSLMIVIERPGAAADGHYYNITGKDISAEVRPFEPWVDRAPCPVIAIGDGGNEIGMGSAGKVLETLNIRPAVSTCDELVVADVSNWGAYAIIAMAQKLSDIEHHWSIQPRRLLGMLSAAGSVDGVTHQNTLTEDGLDCSECEDLLDKIHHVLFAPTPTDG